MLKFKKKPVQAALLCAALGLPGAASAEVFVQCPGDDNSNAQLDPGEEWNATTNPTGWKDNQKCMHLVGADGFVNMADGYLQYIFGFGDVTGTPNADVIANGMLAAESPAPTIVAKEGDELYLSLTNVGMVQRPDLFDPHTVHFHGFPNAASIFDGLPEASISINMGATLTYYYNIVRPGTYMYHCHVEATEHMQMGMLGNLYIEPAQNGTPHVNTADGKTYTKFVYNDGDGSTGFDVEVPIQIGSFDHKYHDASMNTQPLPFADMRDTYPMLNGRGYPDTVLPNNPQGQAQVENGGVDSQPIDTIVTAEQGQKILLRISNLNVTRFYTLQAEGLTMQVVGRGAAQLRGPGANGKDLYYDTTSVNLGGGEVVEVLIDTAGVAPGTYFLYSSNLQYLSNNQEDYGGMMTEITITAPGA